MTLRHRIALTFSLLTTGVLLLILAYVYFHSLNYERREFRMKLRERVGIAIQAHLKADELSREVLNQVRNEHLRSLKGEKEFVVRADMLQPHLVLPDFIDHDLIQRVIEMKEAYRLDANEMAVIGMLEHDNEGDFLVFVAAENEVVQKNLADLGYTLLSLAVIYMVLVYSLGLWYASYALSPFSEMAEDMRRVDSSAPEERLPEPQTKDEIWELAHSFNGLMDRISTTQRVQQNFISNASHELKNPLTAILGEIDVTLQRERSNEQYKESMRVIEQESQRLHRLTMRLLLLAETSYSASAPLMGQVDLAEVAQSLLEDYRLSHPQREFALLAGDEGRGCLVQGNGQLLRIAVSNVLDNAVKFSSGPVSVGIFRDGDAAVLSVTDSGIGIPQEDIERLFIPFFRSDNARLVPGFGIGLALVKRILDMHRASLQVRPGHESGTEFRLIFPSAQAQRAMGRMRL